VSRYSCAFTNLGAPTIPTACAWSIALDPSGSKLYAANGASNDVLVVDLKSRKELRRIKVGDGPWGIADITKEGRLGSRHSLAYYPPA
jgi:YVTN family beta-propeller protein